MSDERAPASSASDDEPLLPHLLAGGVEDGVALVLFWALLAAVFLQFFTRYVLNDSIAWTEEVARYLLVLLAFVGSIKAFRRASHIAVEAVVDALPAWPKRLVHRLTDILAIALLLWSAWLSAQVMLLVRHQRLVSVEVPLSWLYAVVAVAFVLMAVRVLQRLVRELADRRERP